MKLLPQDVLIMIKLVVSKQPGWSYSSLAHDLCMSPSMIHSSIGRSSQARLFDLYLRRPRKKALEEFLIHGVKYAFPADIGSMTRGVPTAYASPAFKNHISYSEGEIYVWPYPKGEQRGLSFSPLYSSVPEIVMHGNDEELYYALGLIDAIRLGRSREMKFAEDLLINILKENA